jgi:hypothetical protein
MIVNQISSIGFESTAQRFLPELLSNGEGKTLKQLTVKMCIWRFITFAIVATLLYPFTALIADVLDMTEMSSEVQLFLFVIVFELFARFLNIVFDSFLLQGISQVLILLRAGTRLLLVFLFIYMGQEDTITLETWIYIDIFAGVIGSIWGISKLWHFLNRTEKESPGNDVSIEYERYRNYAIPIYLAGNVAVLSGQGMIRIVAARLLTTLQFASFGFAANFVAMLNRYLPMTALQPG